MPDSPLDSLSRLTWADCLVLGVVLLFALFGLRQGLLRGLLGLLGLVVPTALAFLLADPVAALLREGAPNFAFLAGPVAFVLVLVVAQFTWGTLMGWAARPAIGAVRRYDVLRSGDSAFGLALGLVKGVIVAALLLLPFQVLPVLPDASTTIARSEVARPLANVALGVASQAMSAFGGNLGETLATLTPPMLQAPPTQVVDGERIEIGPVSGPLEPDPAAEAQMLALVNAARRDAGLGTLVADEPLRAVARAHSQEMFRLGYFAHESPVTGTPFDRMHAAGIRFVLAGENLALAPDVQTAHTGLMNSPGHRANILRPGFGKVGIGVIRSATRGRMFSQEFTN